MYSFDLFLSSPVQFFRELYLDMRKDKKAQSGSIVLCAGLPKSGTTLVESIFDYSRTHVVLKRTSIRRFTPLPEGFHGHEIHDGFFSYLPKNKKTFAKFHCHWSENVEKIINKYQIKCFVMVRDPRDMLVSWYEHIMERKDHWAHQEIINLPRRDGFYVSLKQIGPDGDETVLDYYINWISGWIERGYPIFKLEDYMEDKNEFIVNIAKFLDDYNDFNVSYIVGKIDTIVNEGIDFKDHINRKGRKRSTYRRGGKNYLSDYINDDSSRFIGDKLSFIIKELGYE